MFWRGGISPTGFWNKDGWYGRGPFMGQQEQACESADGRACALVASRLNAEQAETVLQKMKFASESRPDCLENAGTPEAKKSLETILGLAVDGINDTAALTPPEAEFVKNLESCLSSNARPTVAAPMPELPGSMIAGIPTNTVLIGGGLALGALALLVSLSAGK